MSDNENSTATNYEEECLTEVIEYLRNAQVGAHALGHVEAEFRISRALSAMMLPTDIDIFTETAVDRLLDISEQIGGE